MSNRAGNLARGVAKIGGQKVPAGPTWRLLDELVARGWSKSELARRLGLGSPALQFSRDRVRASTARAVEALHAELVQIPVVPKRTRWGVRPTPVPKPTLVLPHHRRSTGSRAGLLPPRTLPLAPLAEAAGMSENMLCRHLGLNLTRVRDGLDERQADELATRLGFHPVEIWGDGWMVAS